MLDINNIVRGHRTAESRWARFGPYYAMFPVDFAFNVIDKYSNEGDFIIDPFAGRCTSIFAGGVLGRHSLGFEINPIGWLYGKVKLNPSPKAEVVTRLNEIYSKRNYYRRAIERMPQFYRMCYCDEVLKFLLATRKHLNWKEDNVDATLMAIILVCLHGKIGEGLSNQMMMTKAMGIKYSIDWWQAKGLSKPPEINPKEFLSKKISWRFEKGIPDVFDSKVVFGDSTVELDPVVERSKDTGIKFSLLFTSPPYNSVTDYHADQWLRLWLLGGPETPAYRRGKHQGRFVSKTAYYELLDGVFGKCATLMDDDNTVYVRTDSREYTFNSTLEVLKKHFPDHECEIWDKPFTNRTQTEICGNSSLKSGEIDIIMYSSSSLG